MGSSGSGRLSDYSGKPSKREIGGEGESGISGGEPGEDPCTKAFSTTLEDVERCAYYKDHSGLPPKGEAISISLSQRLCALSADGKVIGYLPTAYNYLASCMKNGFKYSGLVASSSLSPVIRVRVDVIPTE